MWNFLFQIPLEKITDVNQVSEYLDVVKEKIEELRFPDEVSSDPDNCIKTCEQWPFNMWIIL